MLNEKACTCLSATTGYHLYKVTKHRTKLLPSSGCRSAMHAKAARGILKCRIYHGGHHLMRERDRKGSRKDPWGPQPYLHDLIPKNEDVAVCGRSQL
jgi:hypothetical protein